MNLDFLNPILDFFNKTSLSKLKYLSSKVKYLLITAILSIVYYFIIYKQPEQVLDEYFDKLKLNGRYIEESWDLLHANCQKSRFRSYKEFRDRQDFATFENLNFRKIGEWSLDDLIPTQRDFNISFTKIETITKEHLLNRSSRAFWLFAKNPNDYTHILQTGVKKKVEFDYNLKFQVKKLKDDKIWKIIAIDTISVAIVY